MVGCSAYFRGLRISAVVVMPCLILGVMAFSSRVAHAQERTSDADITMLTGFAGALELFYSLEQDKATAEFAGIITQLTEEGTEIGSGGFWMLARCFAYRAQARLGSGDDEGARADLRRLLQTDPTFTFDERVVSKSLQDMYAQVRQELSGRLSVVRAPDGVVAWIDGVRVNPSVSAVPVTVGDHIVRASLRGYRPVEQRVVVQAAQPARVTMALRPASTEVRVIRTTVVLANAREDSNAVGVANPGELLELLDERAEWFLVRPAGGPRGSGWTSGWVAMAAAVRQ